MKTQPKPDRQAHTAGPSAMAMKCAEKIREIGYVKNLPHGSLCDSDELATIIDGEYREVVEAAEAALSILVINNHGGVAAKVEQQLRSAIQGVREL